MQTMLEFKFVVFLCAIVLYEFRWKTPHENATNNGYILFVRLLGMRKPNLQYLMFGDIRKTSARAAQDVSNMLASCTL